MKKRIILFSVLVIGLSMIGFSQQIEDIKLNPEKVKMYTPFMEWKHGGKEKFEQWKATNKLQYAKEMWYYSESFYIKRDHFKEGDKMDASMCDITRFEGNRLKDAEAIVVIPGFRDVLVLLPENKLIYKLH